MPCLDVETQVHARAQPPAPVHCQLSGLEHLERRVLLKSEAFLRVGVQRRCSAVIAERHERDLAVDRNAGPADVQIEASATLLPPLLRASLNIEGPVRTRCPSIIAVTPFDTRLGPRQMLTPYRYEWHSPVHEIGFCRSLCSPRGHSPRCTFLPL